MKDWDAPCGTSDLLGRLSGEHQLAMLRTLVDSAVDAIIAHQPDGTLVFYNQSACQLLGLSRGEMAHLAPYGWIGPDSQRGAPNRLERILHEGHLVFTSSAAKSDGTVVPTEVTARRVDTELGPVVVAVIRDVSDRTKAQERLQFLAYHDGLTGLSNRTAFDERLALAIADSKRFGDLLILAYIDLDDFKPVNDKYGHEVGDQVLVEVGARLVEDVRVQDLVARLGGDEFVIILQRVESTGEIPGIAERILTDLRRPFLACGQECRIDASIGFAVFEPGSDDARSLIVKADVAMYAAKRDPEHRWLTYESAMGEVPAPADARDE